MAEAGSQVGATVGVVGAGVAGAFVAHFLRETFEDRVRVALFERSVRVGGRVRLIEFEGVSLEAGGKAIHSSNRYMREAIEAFDLPPPAQAHCRRGPGLGVWNGSSFDFFFTGPPDEFDGRFFARYGRSLVAAGGLVGGMVESLNAVYERQRRGEAWETPEEMLRALGLYDLTQVDGYTYLRDHGISDTFAFEVSDSLARANYGQSSAINAFATLVSLAGGGFGGGMAGMAEGGYDRLLERMIEQSGAALHKGADVRRIEAAPAASGGKKYVLRTRDGQAFPCDVVVIATPLELAGIEFQGVFEEGAALRAFQSTHVTFVLGRLNHSYFGSEPDRLLPDLILTTENPAIPFSTVGLEAWWPERKHRVYKLFSREEIKDEVLDAVFVEWVDATRIVWQAYPVLLPVAKWPPFRLGPGLYYVNAIESAVSTMETEAIAARNVVNLMAREGMMVP